MLPIWRILGNHHPINRSRKQTINQPINQSVQRCQPEYALKHGYVGCRINRIRLQATNRAARSSKGYVQAPQNQHQHQHLHTPGSCERCSRGQRRRWAGLFLEEAIAVGVALIAWRRAVQKASAIVILAYNLPHLEADKASDIILSWCPVFVPSVVCVQYSVLCSTRLCVT